MRWIFGLLVAFIAGIVLVATAASAQDVELPIETVFRGDPGDIFHVATIPAEPGLECTAELSVVNSRGKDPSTHPNNDIMVGPVVFTNVETASFQAAALTFTTTGPIDVAVRLGGDGVFSAGFTLEVTCNPPTTTTLPPSTSVPTTTIAVTTTTVGPPGTPTTLSPPPEGGIDTGGGSCADGACDGSLSPLMTWLLIGGVWAGLAGLAWAFIAGGARKETPNE